MTGFEMQMLEQVKRIAAALERLGKITDEQPKSPAGADNAHWRREQERKS